MRTVKRLSIVLAAAAALLIPAIGAAPGASAGTSWDNGLTTDTYVIAGC